MPPPNRTKAIQDLVDRGVSALKKQDWFEAERVLERSLSMSRGRDDFVGMIEILEQLQTARSGRRKDALASRTAIRIVDDQITDTMEVERGRWMVQPPLVGADARRLRLLALARQVPVMVLCREPTTKLGQIPVVAIGPSGAIRAQVPPPSNEKKPSASWFRDALAELGEAARSRIDPAQDILKRVDAVLNLIDTLPEDDGLHKDAIAICREASQ
ncbi:MAG: hypothetical protein MK100_01160 [Phycisphaerales bacterium]|nr:hypothetical protein [Phycisphaerales bacterium]